MQDNIEVCKYEPEYLAKVVADYWDKWDDGRVEWVEAQVELRKYLFATDTTKTTNSKLPWKNSTVTPKLTQIRENLHANYMAALFPNDDWFVWQADDQESALKSKKEAITAYMKAKLKASKFELLVSQLVYDYIDYGNVIAGHEFVNETKEVDGDRTNIYTGPRAFRVNPRDVVFNPVSTSFEKTPLIRRMLKSTADLITDMEDLPELGYDRNIVMKAMDMRQYYSENPEHMKQEALTVDGFGSLQEYLDSDMVELLEFWGDCYDRENDILYRDHIITIIDRKWVLRATPNRSALGRKPFHHCGWRLRPDNLWAQGPLDNLVGMQYRIDHLENLKADVFDQIAYPLAKIKGNTVEEFEYEPGAVIFCGDEGDVEFLRPDATALQADVQIQELMARMEEMAGAPKQAMGIRTPGEKTAYEVQTLENAAGRIFQSKVSWFERNILEPLLNGMLEDARRNVPRMTNISHTDSEGVVTDIKIDKKDLTGTGKLYPIGARHFAEDAKFVQEMANTLQLALQSPTVAAHFSGFAIAKALEDRLGWGKYGIVKKNIAIQEQAETQRSVNQEQENLAAEDAVGIPPTGGEV